MFVFCGQTPGLFRAIAGFVIKSAVSRQNLSLGFPTRSDTNGAAHSQRMARDLELQI